MDNLTKQISFRVTEEEYAYISHQAQVASMTPAKYARTMLINGNLTVIDRSAEMLASVAKISTSANLELAAHNEKNLHEIYEECKKLWLYLK